MIKAVIIKNSNGSIKGFNVKGHAQYAKKGQDIVCAAVSMLVINTINSIHMFTEEAVNVFEEEQTGTINCMFSSETLSAEADILLKSMILGLKSAKEQYGKYIELSEECY